MNIYRLVWGIPATCGDGTQRISWQIDVDHHLDYLQFELLAVCGYWTAFSMFASLTVSLNLIDWIDGTYCKDSVHVSSWIVCHEWDRKQVFVTTHWDFGLFPTCTNHAVASATSFRLLLCLCVNACASWTDVCEDLQPVSVCLRMLCCLCDCLVTCLYMRRVSYMEHNWVKHATYQHCTIFFGSCQAWSRHRQVVK